MTLSSVRLLVAVIICLLAGCGKKGSLDPLDPVSPVPVDSAFDVNSITDTYASITPFAYYTHWGPYNVHDPSIVKSGDYFYCFSTDVGYGITIKPGIQIRKSKDLVQWEFVGLAFNGLPAKGAEYITRTGGTPFQSLWAPYVLKVNNQYRLYYSLSCSVFRLSAIGLATATTPEGPWTEQDLVVTSSNDFGVTQTNAIDPTVVVTPQGEHWLYYGSAFDGIYVLKLDANTGLPATSGDKGKRIAQRGFTNGIVNGNIEGPEIIYNAALNKYYLFIAYDWLETKYNVRVGRSANPQGPFLDYNGKDINNEADDYPMILAPYQFQGHGGWQGVSHCSVFEKDGQYFMAHQGRPSIDKFFMDLHIRKVFWTPDGWPVVSPERYANVVQSAIASTDLTGDWEQIVLGYKVVPGYAAEQVNADLQIATTITLNTDGKINGNAANSWSYFAPWLELKWNNGAYIDKVYVSRERDWENKKNSTLVFTGLNNLGIAVWGKKKSL
ncbi:MULTISPECIES: family 43 glycosylhydrolase [Niastella]|uniref:Arabinan endo-1,5-alpha-L-arabinosidase n=1 Tax=Niastella soli TaxID=2821487 RepID=A0ABS3Z0U6_9BACT|nr:family 43 glycosylhydrolase [Niastella soli]MBO9203797.1 arabinan endo-1,5-alpha-L-arabinosidase [Niastella soli]